MPGGPGQRLDVWLKGPVYYDTDVCLRASADAENRWFALSMDGKKLPSLVGRWRAASPGERLIDDADAPLPLNPGAAARTST